MRSIIKAAIRIIIVIMFLKSLLGLVNNLSGVLINPALYEYRYSFYTVAISLAIIFTGMLILYLLWRKTDWLVRIIAGNINENEVVISTSNLDLIKVAMRILGIYLLVTSVPTLIGMISYHLSLGSEFPRQMAMILKDYVTEVITILIGAWLVLGTKGINKVVDNVLNAPISDIKEE